MVFTVSRKSAGAKMVWNVFWVPSGNAMASPAGTNRWVVPEASEDCPRYSYQRIPPKENPLRMSPPSMFWARA